MVEKIPIRRLSRGQQEALQRAKEFGDVAEDVAAEEYDVVDRSAVGDWYDLVDEDTGTKFQVKSTSSRIGSDYPGRGRYRLWQTQHRSLTTCEGQGTAWYVFVLLAEEQGEIWLQRKYPTTVTGIVNARGGWNLSGHQMGEQHKLPWPAVFDG